VLLSILALYVDYILIFSNNEKHLTKIKKDLMSKFNMNDLGVAKHALGIEIKQECGKFYLNQTQYINSILKGFNMQECQPISTPMECGKDFNSKEKDKGRPQVPYQSLTGSLMCLAVCTRPDIAHAVSLLSQFNSCYTTEHWKWAKRVLRYLKGTMEHNLLFRKTKEIIKGYADVDLAGDKTDRLSYTGLLLCLEEVQFHGLVESKSLYQSPQQNQNI
jgi:hypothetical protein